MSTDSREKKIGEEELNNSAEQKQQQYRGGDDEELKILSSMSDLSEKEKNKLNKFLIKFKNITKRKMGPNYIVRAPGRVNLIGEHIDYHGFPVLPMAIEKAIWIGVCIDPQDPEFDSNTVHLINADEIKYPAYSFKHTFSLGATLDKTHFWQNYVICGYHGALANQLLGIEPIEIVEHAKQLGENSSKLFDANDKLKSLSSLTIFVDSDLPEASGMSSSSALVCASAVATLIFLDHQKNNQLNDKNFKPSPLNTCQIAAMCSKFEYLIGTRGGGMDQAVIMTAEEKFAKYIEFEPSLRCESIKLPTGVEWIISHCGQSYQKAATKNFNIRVLETKLGAAILTKKAKLTDIELDSTISLAKVQKRLGMTKKELIDYVTLDVFGLKDYFTVEEICTILELDRDELIKRFDTDEKYLDEKLRIQSRVLHVISEAERVDLFKSECDKPCASCLENLGQLITTSHNSLQKDFSCSTDALDNIVEVALEAGALGSRLTGAGFGGCAVTLVETSKSDQVYQRLQEVSSFLFRTEPRSGCKVIKVDE